ncbi:MAG: hypothetical protein ABI691_02840 [Ginsengibacter sp.]
MRVKTIFTLLFIGIFISAWAQKGEKSISAGPLISFPFAPESSTGQNDINPGLGLEAIGQYNFTDKSALLLKTTLTSWGYKKNGIIYDTKRLTLFSLQFGYKLQFLNSGFFIDGLVGTDTELRDGFTTISFTLGAGKRFMIKDNGFMNVAIDLVGGDVENRINLKVIFSLFQWLPTRL